jgi:two-component system response regulator FixJ
MADTIHIALVDDDSAVLDSLALYFARRSVKTTCFAAAEALLAALDGGAPPDCIVSDVRMPGLSGLELVQHLAARRCTAPIILITGRGDIDMAVSAIKGGAFDFIEKPFDEGRLLASIHNAVAIGRRKASDAAEIESQLNISPKTVENHRAWVMERIGAKNLAELVRIALQIEGRR